MKRPAIKSDNFFLLFYNALRGRRLLLPLRLASHCLAMVVLVLLVYGWVIGTQLKQVMQQQAEVVGQSLITQTAASATNLLVANDILSLNVLLNNLVKNPLVAHAAVYSIDNRILAEAGARPKAGLLGESDGLFATPITFQEVIAGQLRISLDMRHFKQPMSISLQSMALLSLILLALTLWWSQRLGRTFATPLEQLGEWLDDPDGPAPGSERQDEIGTLARQLQAHLAPLTPAAPTADEAGDDLDETFFADLDPEEFSAEGVNIPETMAAEDATSPEPDTRPPHNRGVAHSLDEDDPFSDVQGDFDDLPLALPQAASTSASSQASTCVVLAIQIGSQAQLRNLPRPRLLDLLERYRDCLDQASKLYTGQLHTLNDGSSLLVFRQHSSDDYLGHALCCGELLRALGHALQIEVADSGISLQLQLGLTHGEVPETVSQGELLLSDVVLAALDLSQHSRNLLLVDARIGVDPHIRSRARLRAIPTPSGAYCVESLLPPYPALLERQLSRLREIRSQRLPH